MRHPTLAATVPAFTLTTAPTARADAPTAIDQATGVAGRAALVDAQMAPLRD